MKLLRYKQDNRIYFGKLENDKVYEIEEINSLEDFIKSYPKEKLLDLKLEKEMPLEKIEILPIIENTNRDVLCVGVNYLAHLEESRGKIGEDEYEAAVYFSKRCNGVKKDGDEVKGFFDLDEKMDYEVELGIIIGKEGINIKRENAADYIYAYTIINDLSSRGIQKKHSQWHRGKSLDGYLSMGPYLVVTDDKNFHKNLDIRSKVNGELRQSSNTELMIRDVETIISELSQGMTLKPGDIIATGTPGGVGMGFNPPKFLKSGDVVELEIENIGKLINYIK